MTSTRRPARTAFVCLFIGLVAVPAWAQTAADLFDARVLHTLHLTVHSRDWEDLHTSADDDYPAELTWNGLRAQNVGIRARGFGSRSSGKPGLEVVFDRYAARQRFLGLRGLVLDNMTTDPSMMRERLAMAFFARVGLPAPRVSYARVFVNGSYVGVYAIVERVDTQFTERTLGEPGTLFEYRWSQPFFATYPGESLDGYRTLFAPRDAAGRSTFDLYAPVRELFQTINEAPDATFVADVGALLDLEHFLWQMAADATIAEWDGFLGYDGINNVYLYRHGPRSLILPWDKDQTFHRLDYPVLAGATQNVLMRRALGTPSLRATFVGALTLAAQTAASGNWLANEVEAVYAQIRPAVLTDPFKPFSNADFEGEVAFLRTFARTRPAFVLDEARRLR